MMAAILFILTLLQILLAAIPVRLQKRVAPLDKFSFNFDLNDYLKLNPTQYYVNRLQKYQMEKASICDRWETISLLGEGTNGQVLKVFDHKLNKEVALKITFTIACQHELEIQKILGKSTHILPLIDTLIISPHTCVQVFPLMERSLFDVQMSITNRRFDLKAIRVFGKHILWGLKAMHAKGVVHNDLKPDNILFESNPIMLKLCDFGLSFYQKPNQLHAPHFYEAPESTLGYLSTEKVDIWGFGIILLQLYFGRHILPYPHGIQRLYFLIHTFDMEIPHYLQNAYYERMVYAGLLDKESKNPLLVHVRESTRFGKPLNEWIETIDSPLKKAFFEDIKKILIMDPALRPTAQQILNLSFFKEGKLA